MIVEKIYRDKNGNIVDIKRLWKCDGDGKILKSEREAFDAEQRRIDPDWFVNWDAIDNPEN